MIYLSEKPCIIDESDLCEDFLISHFLRDPRQVVYVCRSGNLSGIITLGNFRRHFFRHMPLIQEQYSYATIDDEKCAEEILNKNPGIYAVPVLDDKNHIRKEYRKTFRENAAEMISCCVILHLFREFVPSEDNARNIVITRFMNRSQQAAAKKIALDTQGALIIMDEKDFSSLDQFTELSDAGVIYDCIPETFRIREIIYKKLRIPFSLVRRPAMENVRELYHDYLCHYKSIAFLEQEYEYFESAVEQGHSITILKDHLVWRTDKDCYEYTGKITAIPEALCVSCCILKNPCILLEGHIIPVISKEWPIFEQYTSSDRCSSRIEARSSDYDIVYNLIPQLNKNKVKTLIISNIDMEWESIKQFDKQNWRRLEEKNQKDRSEYFEIVRRFVESSTRKPKFFDEYKSRQIAVINGYPQVADLSGNYINVFHGERLTIGNPIDYEHTLWLLGPCLVFGTYVTDENTIGSLLREKINNHYYIKNMGFWFESRHLIAREAVFVRGDIVIFFAFDPSIYRREGYEVHSLSEVYQNCPALMDHVLDSLNHADSYLKKRVSDYLYNILEKQQMLQLKNDNVQNATLPNVTRFGLHKKNSITIPVHLQNWLKSLTQQMDCTSKRIGAIVMNCNPFTLGHRYLIEQACSQVDRLIIFVVEEDKSFFKFKDRLAMVRMGTEDMEKVMVIPSGQYIISAATLPGYFEKDDNPDIIFDATDDLALFSEVIAKELNISVRFAGEEPIDTYTRKYNQAMGKILPEHGIEFIEIPRKKYDGTVISASRVRQLMKEKRFEEIKELVMPKVYLYLEKYY